ncbi:MAG: NuoM family protein [Candidatus Obscuribacterales bacterium]|nr:NuoM family protein [Candidatus Obscuribacterales bacterium]
MSDNLLLNFLLFLPLIGTILIGIMPQTASRLGATFITGLMCVVSSVLAMHFDPHKLDEAGHCAMQFVQKVTWFSAPIPVEYHVGVDGMSLCLVVLTSYVAFMAVLASQHIGQKRPRLYYSMLMLLTLSIVGVFVSLDLLQFFIMYELELVPMYFLIAIWGGPNRDYAAMKFLLYTFFGGVLMLGGILYMYFQLHLSGIQPLSFDMIELAKQGSSLMIGAQALACLGFFLAFIIKLPSFPFHTWLPDAHVEAPTPVSMILAGLLLKMGSYGLVRICLGFFPEIISAWAPYIILLGAFNVVWAAVACLVQTDMKRVIAFSSVSHMGFVLIGVGSLSAAALNGAIFQMISHGVISAALFFLVGCVYDRCHTRDLREIGGGLAKQMPFVFYFWLLAAMANLGLPGLAGFVAEAVVFYGTYTSPMATAGLSADPSMVRFALVLAATGVILSAGYMLWLLKRLFYGPEQAKWVGHLSDMNCTERLVAIGLSVFIIALGVYPQMLTKAYTPYTDQVCKAVLESLKSNQVTIQ